MREDNDELDQMLDRALTSYVEQEPHAGFEQRLLARVRVEGFVRGFVWWPWVATASATACITLAILLWPHGYSSQHAKGTGLPQRVVSSGPVAASKSVSTGSTREPVRAAKNRALGVGFVVASERGPLPKLDTFPSPLPATGEERQLQALAAQPEAVNAFESLKQEQSAELRIASIDIPPLTIGDEIDQPAGAR